MTEQEARALCTLAGIPVRAVFETPNKYWRSNEPMGPWWVIVTPHGTFRMGWRKRVIEIDWSATGEKEVHVTDDDVTKGDFLVHAWDEGFAVRYLEALWAELHRRAEEKYKKQDAKP